ncbi:twin-arginine translocase TatA/TatE family subunit [Hymenobacter norwichensis]|uniref:twin-arginine translocase TatA/TatE family subunit n=1 Tax=Hymenobacter norwichensis TaxID=223903 RepID=UPI0003B3234F
MQTPLLFLGDIGGSEMLLIMVAILVFFGANKIPELARGLGKGIREFKDASREIRSEFENADQPQQQPYQQQFNQNYIAPAPPVSNHVSDPAPEQLPDDAYMQTEPTYSSPGTTYTPPVAQPASANHAAPTSAERPRLDQMS